MTPDKSAYLIDNFTGTGACLDDCSCYQSGRRKFLMTGALAAGLHGIWYNPTGLEGGLTGAGVIRNLSELVASSS